jgi:hypothetical protein
MFAGCRQVTLGAHVCTNVVQKLAVPHRDHAGNIPTYLPRHKVFENVLSHL